MSRAGVIVAAVIAITSAVVVAFWLGRRPDGSVALAPDASEPVEAPWVEGRWTEPPEDIFARIPAPAVAELRCAADGGLAPPHRDSRPLAVAGEALVAAGLPDPRGCEWHEVTFVVDRPGSHPLGKDESIRRAREDAWIGLPYPKEGWLLPGGKLGFSVDGVVRRIAHVGPAARFDEYVLRDGSDGGGHRIAVKQAYVLTAIYADRAGHPRVAARLLQEREDSHIDLVMKVGGGPRPKVLPPTARALERAGDVVWLEAEYGAVLHAFRAGAYEWTVAAGLRTLEHLASKQERDEFDARRSLELRQLVGDAFRRLHEPARPSLAELSLAPPSIRRRALIALLDTVQEVTTIDSGYYPDPADPVLAAVVREGAAIVPGLSAAAARDRRLAQGGETWRTLSVATVAKDAMERIAYPDAGSR